MKLNTLPAGAAAVALALPIAVSQAAPRAESAVECGIAADMAVVAHSLAREQIQRQKADAIMVRIYDVSESDRGKELMRDIIDAAYSKDQDGNASAGGSQLEPEIRRGPLRHLHEERRRHGSHPRQRS